MIGDGVVAAAVKETAAKIFKTQFVLQGFSEAMGFRIFAFEGIAADRSRTSFTVRTDLALARRYGIRLQELPLLCREILDEQVADGEEREYTYPEERMSLYAGAAGSRDPSGRLRKR